MALHGKIVVIRRSGRDGTELPLTTTCLFGRNPECDIRIQLPDVSKEHCRIELNENKEVILTNLSLVNPTRINGKVIQQSKRLNHGDVIMINERCFRFEYPPDPTPKKRGQSASEKSETLQVLQQQQLKDPAGAQVSGEKEQSCLKDGTNITNMQSSKDQGCDSTEKDFFSTTLEQANPNEKESLSPFSELYQMIKQNLRTKSPWQPSGVQQKVLTSKHECQKTIPVEVNVDKLTTPSDESLLKSGTPKSTRRSSKLNAVKTPEKTESSLVIDSISATRIGKKVEDSFQRGTTPAEQTPKKGRRLCQSPTWLLKTPDVVQDTPMTAVRRKTPQKFSAEEVMRQIMFQDASEVHEMATEKSLTPKGRRSKGAHSESVSSPHTALIQGSQSSSPACPFTSHSNNPHDDDSAFFSSSETVSGMSPKTKMPESSQRKSPRSTAGKKLSISDVLCELESSMPSSGESKGKKSPSSKKRKSCDFDSDLPQLKRKRVSFGGQLSPELFDKHLPPNSPLRKGATPGRRSLSVMKKQQSLLRRASVIGLIQELSADQLDSKSPGCSEKKTSAKNVFTRSRTPSPAKSPNVIPKIPSPSRQRSPKVKSEPPSNNNSKFPPTTVLTPSSNRCGSSSGQSFTSKCRKSPTSGSQTPVLISSVENVVSWHQTRDTPCGRKSPCSEQKSSSKTSSAARNSLFVNDSMSGQTTTIRGRFSVSRIETPSPVSNKSMDVSENFASEVPTSLTPKIPLRRTSLKSSKKTPRSSQKSALEVIRCRRSGASHANLKVVSSWADIVKFGAAKPQVGVTVKKQIRKAVKKPITQKPKTPARKIKEHFSTGHAASPATIVVGKAHAIAVKPAGCAPKLVPNIALLKKNMKMNEDFTGVAEMFSTPVSTRKKTNDTLVHHCSKTPQNVPGLTSAEASVINTPDETGEMLVSPLSIVTTAKQGSYNSDAVLRLLHSDQEFSFTCEDSLSLKTEKLTNKNVQTFETNSVAYTEQDALMGRKINTPKQKPEAVTPMTGVKRIMKTPKQKVQQVEDLRDIKIMLKTPKNLEVAEVKLSGVKKLFKTPKVKGQLVGGMVGVPRLNVPSVCSTGVKRLQRTPRQKNEPVEDMVGVKRLMRTPRQKNLPVEDMVGVPRLMKTPKTKIAPSVCSTGVKRLLRTPRQKKEPVEDFVGVKRLMRTPRQKNEPVEDMVGVKRLMRSPRQKNEPVEDMVGVKRLMRSPRQKNEPVEDMVGVKRLMQTPKKKGKPVESNFGIAKLMKLPRQKVVAVEDYTGLQELMEEPVKYSVPLMSRKQSQSSNADMVIESPSSKYGYVLRQTDTAISSDEPVKLLKDDVNDDSKKMTRRRPNKAVKSSTEISFKSADNNTAMGNDPVLPDVRPKRVTKVARAQSSILKEAGNKGKVTSPVKPTRGRKAKHVVEYVKDQMDKNLDGEVMNGLSKHCNKGEKNTQVLSPKSSAPVQTSVKGRWARKTANAENLSVSGPVRKVGRRRGAKQTNEEDVETTVKIESLETLPQTVTEVFNDQKPVDLSPMTKPKRGKRTKLDTKDIISLNHSLDTSISKKDAESGPVGPEIQPATLVKPRRGRKMSTFLKQAEQPLIELPSKRTHRSATDYNFSRPPSSRPGRGKNVANNLNDVEGTTCVQPEAAIECETKSVRKTRASQKTGQILNAQTVTVSVNTPKGSPEPLVSNDLAVEIPKKANKNGKAASQSKTNKTDKNSVVKEAVHVKSKVEKDVSKKIVTWSSDLSDSTIIKKLPVYDQSDSAHVETAELPVLETQPTGDTPVKSRRGRMARNGNVQVMELSVPKPQDTVLCEVMAQPLKKRGISRTKCGQSENAADVTIAKRGTKRKLASKEVAEELPLDAESSVESIKTALTSKQTRRKASNAEVKTEASIAKRSNSARKAEKGLEDLQLADSPQPVLRGRKRGTQNVELEPEPKDGQGKRLAKDVAVAESTGVGNNPGGRNANASNPGTATRGRGKSKTRPDGLSATGARPVRSTRRK